MNSLTDIKILKRLTSLFLITLIISLIIIVSKYIGINVLLLKTFNALVPVFIAVFLSFLIDPLILALDKKVNNRKISVILAYAIVLLVVIFILLLTIPSLIKQIEIFINNIPNLLNIVNSFINRIGLKIDFKNFLGSSLADVSNKIIGYLSNSFNIIFNILLGVSGALFLSFDFPLFKGKIKNFLPPKIKKPLLYYFNVFLPFVHKYFFGMFIDSIFIFIISMVGFNLIGIDYALVISLIIAVTNLVPIIGPYIGGIPAVIVGLSVSPTLGISALFVVVIVQFIESNFIQPIILKNVISLHPLEGILGISLFGAFFGIIGMILSPILIVGIKLLFIPYKEELVN